MLARDEIEPHDPGAATRDEEQDGAHRRGAEGHEGDSKEIEEQNKKSAGDLYRLEKCKLVIVGQLRRFLIFAV